MSIDGLKNLLTLEPFNRGDRNIELSENPKLYLLFVFGDPCGIRTRDLQDENLMSKTTRRRGRFVTALSYHVRLYASTDG
jgi:hypothetical protein